MPYKSREESIPSLGADGVRHARGTAELAGARPPRLNHALAGLENGLKMVPGLALVMSISMATGNSRANDLSSAQLSSVPSWAIESFDRAGLNAKYAFSTRVNPFYQRADFDGDGKVDLAIFVAERATRKVGIAFIMRSRPTFLVVGAGNPVGDHGDDFNWVDAWSVYDRGPVEQGVGEGRPPKLKGEALLVEKTEAASALLWWDGKGISWYQQGD